MYIKLSFKENLAVVSHSWGGLVVSLDSLQVLLSLPAAG